MLKQIVGCGLIALSFSVSVLAGGNIESRGNGVYTYVGFGGGIVQIRDEGTVMIGDYGVKARVCGVDSEYYCVNSGVFYFAVPKILTENNKSWAVNGREYKVVYPLRWISLFGRSIQVTIIENQEFAPNGDSATTYYYYSPVSGLLGYEATEDTKCGNPPRPKSSAPVLYFLSGKVGFGAHLYGKNSK